MRVRLLRCARGPESVACVVNTSGRLGTSFVIPQVHVWAPVWLLAFGAPEMGASLALVGDSLRLRLESPPTFKWSRVVLFLTLDYTSLARARADVAE